MGGGGEVSNDCLHHAQLGHGGCVCGRGLCPLPQTGSCLWARAAAHLGYKPILAPQVPWDRTASQEPGLSQPPNTCPCHFPHSQGSPSPLSELSRH